MVEDNQVKQRQLAELEERRRKIEEMGGNRYAAGQGNIPGDGNVCQK